MNLTDYLIPGIFILSLFVSVAWLVRNFQNFSLRAKVATGILVTGGIALGAFSILAIDRSGGIITSLSNRLETSVSLLAEEQLINRVHTEAEKANRYFEEIAGQAHRLARYRATIQSQQTNFSQGMYWDAESRLIPLEGGKLGNSSSEISSIFVPSTVELDEAVIKELNTSAYLDFVAPDLLEENRALLSIYYIDTNGVIRYYPNIQLASLLPPDFDAAQRPYYAISTPLFNPKRTTRWSIPYEDAAGSGPVVTVAEPVYIGEAFRGVVAADVKLATITEQTTSIEVGQTGYAFMIDDAGQIISMPAAGYSLFGLNPGEITPDEVFKQSVLGEGSMELNSLTNRMVAGGSGLNIIPVNGVDTYIAYAPIKSNGYSLAIIVPISEMQTSIALARNETEIQTRSALWTAGIILAALFFGAILISLAIAQVIAAPVRHLTRTVNQIVEGDLKSQVLVTSRDEIGTLGQAFNAMTSRLRETLEGLEQHVEERTSELGLAKERNERRANQFEAIAQVARAISTTQDLNSLLPQITAVISREFGFYHVGIFLLDPAKEYAVLSAANSEGGQRMLVRSHRLRVGETGIVGHVTGTGKPRVALDTGTDSIYFNNPDLPETRSEIAFPLQIGKEVIGALDVQSTEPNAFNQEDINILSTLADQVSIAIQNARQYEETRKTLAIAESLSRQSLQDGWSQFNQTYKIEGIHHSGAKATLLYRKNDRGKDESFMDKGQPLAKGKSAMLSLPVKLRDVVIGSVDIRSLGSHRWDQDELDIVNAIIERAALAMENARLLEESQKLAAKERTLGEISAKIGSSINIRNVLQMAVEELGRALPGSEVIIQLEGQQDNGAK